MEQTENNITTEEINVTRLTEWGPKIGDKIYSYSKKFAGDKLAVGETAVVEIYTAASGKKYINKVVRVEVKAAAPFVKSDPQKGRDYDAENRGKTRCQLVAASMPILMTGDVDLSEFFQKVNRLVDYIFDGK